MPLSDTQLREFTHPQSHPNPNPRPSPAQCCARRVLRVYRSHITCALHSAAYASRYIDREGLTGLRLAVPATHPNKYGYATGGYIEAVSGCTAPLAHPALQRATLTCC